MKNFYRNNIKYNKIKSLYYNLKFREKILMDKKYEPLKDILIKAADMNTNITYANVKTIPTKKLGIIELGVEVNSIDKLRTVINALQTLSDVNSVKRIPMNSKTKRAQETTQKSKKKKKK